MRYPQVVIHQGDDKLVSSLQKLADEHKWIVHTHRQSKACLRQVGHGSPTVLVLKIGRDLERELALLQQTTQTYPDADVIVVGDLEHPLLAGLAWDLGASYVLFPPQPRELLDELVVRFLDRARSS